MPHLFLGGEGHEIGVLHLLSPDPQFRRRVAGPTDQGGAGSIGLGPAGLLGRSVRAPAPERGLAGGIEIPQQLALPAVPHTRADGADVTDGQDQQGPKPLRVLHDTHEIGDGSRVRHIPLLRKVRHHQVMLDEPGHRFNPGRGQPEAFARRPGRPGTRQLLAPLPALAGIVQQHGQEQDLDVFHHRRDGHGQRMILHQPASHDVRHHADGAQRVLVDRVGVVHVELHLGHDPPELRQITPQHARFVHQFEGLEGVSAPAQDVEEHLRRHRIPSQPRGYQAQRSADRGKGVRVQVVVRLVRQPEQRQHLDGVAGQHAGIGDAQPPGLLEKAGRHHLATVSEPLRKEAGQPLRAALGLVGLEFGAEHPGQGANLPRNQEIAAHEALDPCLERL